MAVVYLGLERGRPGPPAGAGGPIGGGGRCASACALGRGIIVARDGVCLGADAVSAPGGGGGPKDTWEALEDARPRPRPRPMPALALDPICQDPNKQINTPLIVSLHVYAHYPKTRLLG